MKTTINGKEMLLEGVGPMETAVHTLRQQCHLTGTKFVCGSGVCGACTIRVNGTPMVSCLLPTHHLEGQSIETIEQYAGDNLHPVQRAFMVHDGLQCGYCTPGFVIESIAFYERWQAEHGQKRPSREEVAAALAGHLCRCGAYLGIYAAVQAACAGEFDEVTEVAAQRVDALEKVTGMAQYTTDIQLEGQLVGKILRSPYAHARIVAMDTSAAAQLPGVRAISNFVETDAIIRYEGQPITAVAAIDHATAKAALSAIHIEYEQLPPVIGLEAAMAPDAVEIWQNAQDEAASAAEGLTLPGSWQGNVRRSRINMGGLSPARAHRAFAQTRQKGGHTIEAQYINGIQVHTALEPHCAVAHWPNATHLELYISTQGVAGTHQEVAKHFDLAPENVTVIAEHVGGGFGAKNDLFDEAIAAIKLAKLAKAPVAVIPTRAEEMNVGGMRPGGQVEVQLAASQQGELTAFITQAYNDGGVSIGSMTSALAGMGYAGGARDLRDYDVVNNHAPGKPFRGPGGPGAMWAVEQAVDQLAHNSQLDVIAIRRKWTKNELRLKLYDWVEGLEVWRNRPASGAQSDRFRRGVGVAFGHWAYIYDPETEIEVGSTAVDLTVTTSTQDIGNGVRTTLARTVANVFGLAPDTVRVQIGNSHYPHGPRAGGSRVTVSVYEPTERAATLLRDHLFGLAAEEFDLVDAIIIPGGIQHQSGMLSWLEALPQLPPQKVTIQRGADPHLVQRIGSRLANRMGMDLMFGSGTAHTAVVMEVEVDTLLGKTRVKHVWQNLAIGRTYYPDMARSQLYGAVIQGIGYALYEEKLFDKSSGRNLTSNLQDYRIPGMGDMPEIEVAFTDGGFEHVKGQGVGMSELATMPVAAAVANAVFNATGWRPVVSPITPERLLTGLQEETRV